MHSVNRAFDPEKLRRYEACAAHRALLTTA